MKLLFSVRRVIVVVFVLFALLPTYAAGSAEPDIPPNLDTYEGLRSAIAEGKDILIYDVRTPEETQAGMIPGAVNIIHTEIADTLPPSDRNKVIVVYCQSGGRSRAAYDALVDQGFKHVFDFGSIRNWEGALSQD